jgi:hypothetical protein
MLEKSLLDSDPEVAEIMVSTACAFDLCRARQLTISTEK